MSFPGSDVRIKEPELDSVDMRFVHRVLVAAPDERGSGIEVFSVSVLGTMTSRHTEVEPSMYHQLIVEVEDPDSPETQDRIRTKCMQHWKDRAAIQPAK